MKATKTSEINRYPYLLNLDIDVKSNSKLIGDVTFGREAPGVTGGLVRYCIKRVTLEVKTRDGRFKKILLLDPANVADGIQVTKKEEAHDSNTNTFAASENTKGTISLYPSFEAGDQNTSSQNTKKKLNMTSEYALSEFSFSYYGDKKEFSKWDFEPFSSNCLKGTLNRELAEIVPNENIIAFLVEANAYIDGSDIEAVIKNKKPMNKMKEKFTQWFSKKEFDLTMPVSTIQLSVFTKEVQNEADAA